MRDLRGADLSGVELSGVDLSKVDLSEAKFSEAKLSALYSPDEESAHNFTVAFSPELSRQQIEAALNALADYYRACGGVGFKVDFELASVPVGTPEYVGR